MTAEDLASPKDSAEASVTGRIEYQGVRQSQVSVLQIRLYGIPLDGGHLDNHTPVAYCGFKIEEVEYRECSTRIWHIPTDKILDSGRVEDFTWDGNEVHFFDVSRDTSPVEEQYVALSLGLLARDVLSAEREATFEPASVFGARVASGADTSGAQPGLLRIALQPRLGAFPGWGLGLNGGGPYHTTYVDTKEAGGTKKDPMTDDGAKLYHW